MWGVVFFLTVVGSSVLADLTPTVPLLARGVGGAPRIVAGWEAQPGQFPHMIFLRIVNPTGTLTSCGASIIHAEWGLSAAHCLANRRSLIVNAGSNRRDWVMPVSFEAARWYNHPLYNETLGGAQPHDIAIIEFGRAIVFNDLIQPIRMQRSEASYHNYEGTIAIASGWGRTWTNSDLPVMLNWVYLTLTSNFECAFAYGFNPIIQATTICARYYNVTSQSVCHGDSGGPLTIIDDDGGLTQVGVSNFVAGSGCHTATPSGFNRAGPYHAWFTEVTGINFDWKLDSSEDSEGGSNEGSDEGSNGASDESESYES